ncbi:MAG: hypothetical protein WB586_07185, partial [Chthoniobacterales bacterium]
RFRLLPTPSLDDAVTFSYGQPVLCPTGTSTPLLVRILRRTRAAGSAAEPLRRRSQAPANRLFSAAIDERSLGGLS